jgi:hypothetical protein
LYTKNTQGKEDEEEEEEEEAPNNQVCLFLTEEKAHNTHTLYNNNETPHVSPGLRVHVVVLCLLYVCKRCYKLQ